MRAKEHSEKTIVDLVANIYEAAGNPQVWPVFLENYAEAVRGEYTLLVAHDFSSGTAAIKPALLREYEQHYAALNEWVRRGASQLRRVGNVITEQQGPATFSRKVKKQGGVADHLRKKGCSHVKTVRCDGDFHFCRDGIRAGSG